MCSTRDATSFINRNTHRPFMLEVATFAPHAPYIPAPRNACDFPGLTEPRDPSFGATNVNPPAWLARRERRPLTTAAIATIDRSYRMRAQAVEAVDKLLADVEATLARDHLSEQHLHRVQLRQRLPHGPAPAAARQADGVRHRHPRAADHRWPRRPRRQGRPAGRAERRPVSDLRATRRRRTQRPGRRAQPRPAVASAAASPARLADRRAGRASATSSTNPSDPDFRSRAAATPRATRRSGS